MSVRSVFGFVAILAGVAGISFFQIFQVHGMQVLSKPDLNMDDQAEILGATMQIKVSVLVDASGLRLVQAEGLASLISDGKETLLVTHNHWGNILQEKAVVELYDVQGQLVKKMSGSDFISLMVYLDAGTLILRSPVEWQGQAQPVREGDPHQLQAGEVVVVAQRVGPERKEVGLIEAEVESVTTIRGLSVYHLKALDGQLVQPGDSGGGVWHQGKLLGNLWYTAMDKPTPSIPYSWGEPDKITLKATDESYAARYPADQLSAFREQLVGAGSEEESAIP